MVVLETEMKVTDEEIQDSFGKMLSKSMFRARIKLKLAKFDLFKGKERVLHAIRESLDAQ